MEPVGRVEAEMASHVVDWQQPPPESCRHGAVAIGNFDGAHRGHASLIAELVPAARRLGGPAVALMFDPHPSVLLRPEKSVPLLTSPAERAEQLHLLGADQVLTLRTTPSLLTLRAVEFFEQVVRQRLAAQAMVEGSDFRFGRGREGTIELLSVLCRQAKLALTIVPPLMFQGSEVSSSRIRECLLQGDIATATRLLGRPYRLHGVVGSGQRRGRTIGFPTANLEQVATVIPGDGVYAVRVLQETGQTWTGALNIGPNPTFAEQERKIEVHLIGFQGDLYGHSLAVDFITRLRDTRSFAGPAALIEQLRKDIEQARRAVGELEEKR
jgi:riboflavin kinase/FMN adenylyltransferase